MTDNSRSAARVLRFGVFEFNASAHELRKRGVRLKVQEQPLRVLAALLEKPGQVVTREELKERLWAKDEFVEFDKSLNTAIQKLRQALDDSRMSPRFIETMPRVGYKFLAPVESVSAAVAGGESSQPRRFPWRRAAVAGAILGAGLLGALGTRSREPVLSGPSSPPVLRQITFDTGLTAWPAVSPDGNLVVYASDRADPGNLDLWLQRIDGSGRAIRLTDGPEHDLEPAFSPDGSKIAFHSTGPPSGIYVVPVLGGQPTLLAENGSRPRYSPNGRWLSFESRFGLSKLHVMPAAGGEPHYLSEGFSIARDAVWSPHGDRLLFMTTGPEWNWWTVPIDAGEAASTGIAELLNSVGFDRSELSIPEAWLEDGRVLFSTAFQETPGVWEIVVDPATGKALGRPRWLTKGSAQPRHVRPHPEGGLAYAELTLNIDIWKIPFDHDTGKPTGPPERLTRNVAEDLLPTLSRAGNRMLFTSQRSGNSRLWFMDLPEHVETQIPLTDSTVFAGRISPDGKQFVYLKSIAEKGYPWRQIFRGEIGRGAGSKIYEGPRHLYDVDWEQDRLLLVGWEPGSASQVWLEAYDLHSGRPAPVLRCDSGGFLHDALFSPDGNWVVMHTGVGGGRRKVLLAPARGEDEMDCSEAIPVTDGEFSESKAVFAPDGNRLYYLSNRDGYFCIWTQKLQPDSKRPQGEAAPVVHFHGAGPTIQNADIGNWGLMMATAPGRMVTPLGELEGNIWLMQPSEASQ